MNSLDAPYKPLLPLTVPPIYAWPPQAGRSVPVHPVIILLTSLFTELSPALSHSGFDQIQIFRKIAISGGIFFHDLHHRLYETNYGTLLTPIDHFGGTMHEGPDRAQEEFIAR